MTFLDLANLISEQNPITFAKGSSDIPVSCIARLTAGNTELLPNTLYIGKWDDMPKEPNPDSLFLLQGPLPGNVLAQHSNIAVFTAPDINEVISLAQSILQQDYLMNCELTSLVFAAMHNSKLQDIINKVAELFGNAIIVIDKSYRIIGISTNYKLSKFAEEGRIVNGQFTPEMIDNFSHYSELTVNSKKRVPYAAWCPISGSMFLVFNLFNENELFGHIFIATTKNPVNQIQYRMMSYASAVIQFSIEREGTLHLDFQTMQENLIHDILNSNPECVNDIIAHYRHLKVGLPRPFCVLLIKANANENTPDILPSSKTFWGTKFRFHFHEAHILINNKQLLAVVKTNSEFLSLENRQWLEDIAAEYNLCIGVSNVQSRIENLKTSIKQASFSLETIAEYKAKSFPDSTRVVLYHKIAFRDMLQLYRDKEKALLDNCHPALEQLLQYDSKNGSKLYDTLDVYTSMNLNLKKTAELLYVHKNTLIYRLRRIAEITDIDYENSIDIFNVRISMEIHRCIRINPVAPKTKSRDFTIQKNPCNS